MKILEKSCLKFDLLIETLDDLWVLSQFISSNDKIFAKTERKVKLNSGGGNSKQIKKIIFIELLVKNACFSSNNLKVSGFIQNETEFTAIGQSHSLNFKIGNKISIKKENILKFERDILKNACDNKNSSNLLVLLDKDDLIVSEFTTISFKVLFSKNGLGSKKYFLSEIDENAEKFKLIENYLTQSYSCIIFAGPFNFKDKLSKYCKSKLNKLKILVLDFPQVSRNGAFKVVSKISKENLLGDIWLNKDEEIVNKLLKSINLGKAYSYGFDNTISSLVEGKCETFLISTKIIEKFKEKASFELIHKNLKLAEKLQTKISIINSKNEPGKILDGLGGIGSINRY